VSSLFVGIDVGTTNTKVGVYTADGAEVLTRSAATPPDADGVVATSLRELARCVAEIGVPPVAVGVTGVAEGGVALDGALRPLRPLHWWHDSPAGAQAGWLAEQVGRTALFDRTGVDVAAKTPLALWLWLRRHEPAVLDTMTTWVGVPELVATALCGTPVGETTLAGRSGAFDQRAGRYDPDLLALAGITEDQLAAPSGAGTAAAGPLPTGTPVVLAGHDHLVAAFAAGAREPGDTADSMGTAEAVVTISRTPPESSATGTGLSWNRTADGTHWALTSGFPHSGRLFDWLCRLFGGADAVARLAGTERARPTGIVVLPYLAGRAAPAPDPERRLSVHGLDPSHGPADLALAVLEGACCHVRWMAEEQAAHAGTPIGVTTALGGPTRSRAWMTVKAHVMPATVRVARAVDAACAGAALLAARATGTPAAVLPSDSLPRDELVATDYDALYRDSFLAAAGKAS
jgi:xylulokinase